MNEFTSERIQKAAAGDQDAITELYELTYSSVYKTVKSMVADEDAVLDVVQDSFIKGFQSLDQLDAAENFRAWMKRIATNKAKDYLKKKKPILFAEMVSEDGEEIDFRDDCLEHCPEEVLDRKETTRLMNEILATLSEEQRLVIGMYYYEEMSIREIAETVGCSENTVKSRLNYGRKKVETKVKELEKKGIKLYSLAPLPFLLWLFRLDAEAAEIASGAVLEAITAECAATGTAVAGSVGAAAAASGAKTVAGAGIKAFVVKIVAGVLAVSVVGGGAMLAISSNDREAADRAQYEESGVNSAEQNHTEETISSVSAEEAYQGIASEYRAVLAVDSTTFLNDPGMYFNGDHVAIRYYHMHHGDDFYYAYVDLDGNGMEELLIGFGRDGNIEIVDMYGFDGDMAVQLIDEPTLGDRSRLTLYADGTLNFYGSSSATESSRAYLKVDGGSLIEAYATDAQEMTDIPWQVFVLSDMAISQVSFDSILTDIQTVLMIAVADYDANMERFDAQYAHLGEGALWMLLHRQAGDHTMCIWNTYLDVDGDGQNELCVGRGMTADYVAPIMIYKANGEVICGDALFAYSNFFSGGAPINWNYLGG